MFSRDDAQLDGALDKDGLLTRRPEAQLAAAATVADRCPFEEIGDGVAERMGMDQGRFAEIGEALRPHIAADAVEGIAKAIDDAVGLAAEQATGARLIVTGRRPQRQNALPFAGPPLEGDHQGELGPAGIG